MYVITIILAIGEILIDQCWPLAPFLGCRWRRLQALAPISPPKSASCLEQSLKMPGFMTPGRLDMENIYDQ